MDIRRRCKPQCTKCPFKRSVAIAPQESKDSLTSDGANGWLGPLNCYHELYDTLRRLSFWRVGSMVRNMEHDDMKSERMVIKSAELFERIMSKHESLRAFQRELQGVVSVSTLSNWTKKRDPNKIWEADGFKVQAVAKALGCDVRDIAYCPTPPTLSRYQLRMVLSGCPEQLMDLNVCGEELSLKDHEPTSHALHGHVLSRGEDVLTGHLRVHYPILPFAAGEGALAAEEMTFVAKYSGDTIRGACVVRDRRGNIKQAVFEGIRKVVPLSGA